MQIVTNKNIDTYRDDFFKGLSLAQTVTSVAVILSAGGSFACFYIVLKLPMAFSIYLALPFALPFALAGFMRIHGMSPFTYLKKKKKVVHAAILTRRPSYVVDAQQILSEIYLEKSEEKVSAGTIGKKVFLQTEDEIFLRSKEFEKLYDPGKRNKSSERARTVYLMERMEQKGVDAVIEDKENHEGI